MESALVQMTELINTLSLIIASGAVLIAVFTVVRILMLSLITEGEITDEEFEYKETITFAFIKRNKLGRFKVYKKEIQLSKYKLSDDTKRILKHRIQEPLITLYDKAIGSKRAKQAYSILKGDLESLMGEIRMALDTCQNDKMEQIIISRLPIIEATIDHMLKTIEIEVQMDKDEAEIKETLEAEDYKPFQKTEMENKLNDIGSDAEIHNMMEKIDQESMKADRTA